MAKKSWDAFVAKHAKGYCLSIGHNASAFKPLTGVSPTNGKKWPTVGQLIAMFVLKISKDDWATRIETKNYKPFSNPNAKSQRISIIHLIFASASDCIAAAKVLGLQLDALTPSGQAPCLTNDTALQIDAERYRIIVTHLGYV
jgi:hypothetical protein